ncbi:hypothetical protein BH11PSE9_BH11PSE9_15310 [soil metagenome]
MYSQHSHPHYAPSSVGALMDPAFLRRAIDDAEAHGHAQQALAPAPKAAWRCAMASWVDTLAARLRPS